MSGWMKRSGSTIKATLQTHEANLKDIREQIEGRSTGNPEGLRSELARARDAAERANQDITDLNCWTEATRHRPNRC